MQRTKVLTGSRKGENIMPEEYRKKWNFCKNPKRSGLYVCTRNFFDGTFLQICEWDNEYGKWSHDGVIAFLDLVLPDPYKMRG